MRFARVRHGSVGGALFLVLALVGAGCGDAEEKEPTSGLEKTEISVGTLPVADTAPLNLAVQRGFFQAEGLTVKLQMLAGGAEAVPKLKSGQLDLSFGNYVSFLLAKESGVLDTRIVAEAFDSAEGTHVLLASKDSGITTPRDLAGKKIGINTKRNIGTLLVNATLQPHGIRPDEDRDYVEVPFPEMESALKSKSVDAVLAVEPFNSNLQETIGAREIADTSQGQTANFPIAGYITTGTFAEENPNTVAAFRRAIVKAQGMAADRKTLEAVIPTYTRISAEVAAKLHYGVFPTTLNAAKLQRVADTMQQFGYLKARLDVQSLVSPT